MKRFTKYRDNGYPKLEACDLWRTSNCKEDCVHCEDLTKAIRQLAEYENKIESGQLVELPCKIGDTVYKVDLDRKTVLEGVVRKINYVFCDKCEKEYYIYADCGDRYKKLPWKNVIIGFVFYPEKDWNISTFLTKEQAEAKLRELKE